MVNAGATVCGVGALLTVMVFLFVSLKRHGAKICVKALINRRY